VLIVEDEVLAAKWLEMELTKLGFTVCGRVATGEEAVELALRDRPAVVFMDIRLAGTIDGIEAAGMIRRQSAVAVIFTTGYQDDTVRRRALDVRPHAYLIKPLNPTELGEALAAAQV
jgi:DNA-binding NarL/FixJ family response regulator